MNRLIDFLIAHRKRLALATLILMVALGVNYSVPTVDGKLAGFNTEDNKYYKSGEKIAQFFEISDFIEIKIFPKDTSAATVFEGMAQLDSLLTSNISGASVRSLRDFSFFFDEEINNEVNINKLLVSKGKLPVFEYLISKDFTATKMVVILDSAHNFNLDSFNTLLSSTSFTGIESLKSLSHFHIESAVTSSIKRDLLFLPGLILLLFLATIYYSFRTIQAMVYCGVLILLSLIPVFLCFSFFNVPLNLLTALVIPVILILSLSDSIHLLTAYYSSEEGGRLAKIKEAMNTYIVPSFITSLTTAIAFSSFIFNTSESIRTFGIIIAINVMISFVITYLVSPLALSLMKEKKIKSHGITRIFDYLKRNRKAFSIGLVILSAIAISMVNKLSFNTDFDAFIPRNSEIYEDRKELINDFDSQLAITLLLENKTDNPKEYENRIRGFIKNIESINGVGGVQSFESVESLKDNMDFLEKIVFTNQQASLKFKEDPYYRLTIKLKDLDEVKNIAAIIEESLIKEDFTYDIYSQALVLQEMDKQVSSSLLISLLVSLFLISLVILILTKSFTITLISLFVNLIPLSFLVLIFLVTGNDINILTAIIVVICLGIVVDDTVHMIYRCVILKKEEEQLGFSVLSTSLILVIGFTCFLISSFKPSQIFGYSSAIIFAVTVISDLTLLPYLLSKVRKSKESISNS